MTNTQALLRELETMGLRRAQPDEPGWFYRTWDGLNIWVTTL